MFHHYISRVPRAYILLRDFSKKLGQGPGRKCNLASAAVAVAGSILISARV
jgi:hypothetical protein